METFPIFEVGKIFLWANKLVLLFYTMPNKTNKDLEEAILALVVEMENLQAHHENRHEQLQSTMDARNDALHGVLASIMDKLAIISSAPAQVFSPAIFATTSPTFHMAFDGTIHITTSPFGGHILSSSTLLHQHNFSPHHTPNFSTNPFIQ